MRFTAAIVLTLALASSAGCRTMQRALGIGGAGGSRTTSVFGTWLLATPPDSTAFAGATEVQLVLAPGSFSLTALYPSREPITVRGSATVADGGALTLVPESGPPQAASVGLATGQRITRLASASGNTLILAPPRSSVPLPSSVWHRLEAARLAGAER